MADGRRYERTRPHQLSEQRRTRASVVRAVHGGLDQVRRRSSEPDGNVRVQELTFLASYVDKAISGRHACDYCETCLPNRQPSRLPHIRSDPTRNDRSARTRRRPHQRVDGTARKAVRRRGADRLDPSCSVNRFGCLRTAAYVTEARDLAVTRSYIDASRFRDGSLQTGTAGYRKRSAFLPARSTGRDLEQQRRDAMSRRLPITVSTSTGRCGGSSC